MLIIKCFQLLNGRVDADDNWLLYCFEQFRCQFHFFFLFICHIDILLNPVNLRIDYDQGSITKSNMLKIICCMYVWLMLKGLCVCSADLFSGLFKTMEFSLNNITTKMASDLDHWSRRKQRVSSNFESYINAIYSNDMMHLDMFRTLNDFKLI